MHRSLLLALFCLVSISSVNAFSLLKATQSPMHTLKLKRLSALSEVQSVDEFDALVKGSSDKLLVIDYSTTWCGPCKLVLPKFVELSDKFTDVVFVKCVGDSTADAGKLMKREGVRSVPAFHFWKGGSKIDVINGARIDDVEAAIVANK